MTTDFKFKTKYDISDLLDIMKILRGEGGCPWDREQTHETIKRNFIEETYEVVEAINKNDSELLCEELGDVMLQVVFHAQIENEKGVFGFSDVADGICKKLIERHPHVFSDVCVSTTDEVLTNWDAIKAKTKNRKTTTESMLSVPRELPSLMRSTKIQEKARKVGFDWDNTNDALCKLSEEIDELKEAIDKNDMNNAAEELGDVLFSAVNVSRFIGVDAEQALTLSADKFLKRFSIVENLAKMRNINMESATLEELDKLWDEAKIALASN
ncbi:MAG: nucleoside triphosphate pyrophosphohydrolase [Oscillospiraceae bacterium]